MGLYIHTLLYKHLKTDLRPLKKCIANNYTKVTSYNRDLKEKTNLFLVLLSDFV